MNLATTEHLMDLEKETAFYAGKIRQIDRILEGPVKTLIWVAGKFGEEPGEFPAFLSDHTKLQTAKHPSTAALCLATLQRLRRLQRRFRWLKAASLMEACDGLEGHFLPGDLPPNGKVDNIERRIEMLKGNVFGGLNPLTASHVERVLVEVGELQAHRGVGFLCFFAMLWPLHRRFPDPSVAGARLEPWEPTAYVTANCLHRFLSIKTIATRRAESLKDIADNLERLGSNKTLADSGDCSAHWSFNVELDQLSANLTRLATLAIDRKAVEKCAKAIEELSATQTVKNPCEPVLKEAIENICAALRTIGERTGKVIEEANDFLNYLESELVNPLEEWVEAKGKKDPKTSPLCTVWELVFVKEYLDDPKQRLGYLEDLARSAKECLKFGRDLYEKLKTASVSCLTVNSESLAKTLNDLASVNRDVAREIQGQIETAALWCHSVLTREIAHASAGNVSEFDASELISAMSVAVRCQLLNSDQEVGDAVTKALLGAEPDGSWKAGRPFFSPDNALGIWPETSDMIWTLTQAIEQHPDVTMADESLFRYLDWLERTQTQVRPWSADKDGSEQPLKGWPSERLQHPRKIHLVTTTFTVNALLEIRDLVEYRLWQLCQRRFSAIPVARGLNELDPVDRGTKHGRRLHSDLARLARDAQKGGLDREYSLILHGPPGSSKTEVAKALAKEAWKDTSRWGKKDVRYIRITPADFTRLGEDRVDSEARHIFELLSHVRAVTIHFDEIDDLLRRRDPGARSLAFLDLVVPAMLNRLADLRDACPYQEICFLLTTNYVEKIEPALMRKGRIDRPVAVVYPDADSRVAILWRVAQDKDKKIPKPQLDISKLLTNENVAEYLKKTCHWPWGAITSALEEFFQHVKKTVGDLLKEHMKKTVPLENNLADLRITHAATEAPVKEQLAALQATHAEAEAPVKDQLAALQATHAEAEAPVKEQLAALQAEYANKKTPREKHEVWMMQENEAPLETQLAALQARHAEAEAPIKEQLAALQATHAEAEAPVKEQLAALQARHAEAEEPIRKRLDALQAEYANEKNNVLEPMGKKLSAILDRHTIDLVQVEYDDRWHGKRKSKQLLCEYLRYLIAGLTNVAADKRKIPIRRLRRIWKCSVKEVMTELKKIWEDDGRSGIPQVELTYIETTAPGE